MNRKTLLFLSTLSIILLEIFYSHPVRSDYPQPPAGYVNNPPQRQSCTYCHQGVAIPDSTAFELLIGTDTSNLAILTSGVTGYTPNQVYYLRVQATHTRPRYGFELTADDASANGADVGSFTVLNSANTSLVTGGPDNGSYVGHHNANSNKQWTFLWTAPASNIGPITFYWAGNDAGVDSITQDGESTPAPNNDTIYVAQKTITAVPMAINDISNTLTDINIFPEVCTGNFQLQFNVRTGGNISAELVNMNGQVVKEVFNQVLNTGNYSQNVDVTNLAPGIYLLKLQTGDGYLAKKIIKQ